MLKKETPNFETIGRLAPERDQIADALSLFSDKGPNNEAQSEAHPVKVGHPQATPEIRQEPRPRKKSSATFLESSTTGPKPRTANGHQEVEPDEDLAEPEMEPDRESPSKPRENILNHRPLFD
jgi:hypothetical protein